MSAEYVETVIIGAGQAGLATGYHLHRRGREFLIIDGNARVGDNWRQQWDSLRLYTPAKYDGLPGMPFPGKRWSFPGKDEVADYLESYAARWQLPTRLGTRVGRLEADGDRYLMTTSTGTISCANVVIATGTFGRTPSVPDFAGRLHPSTLQLHSSEYRRPGQLNEGPVLVVGASHSGTDIAYEVAQSHEVTLCGRHCGNIPFRPESATARVIFPPMFFAWRHVLTRRTPMGRALMAEVRFHGAPMLRVKSADLTRRGVRRETQRVTGVQDGRPQLADGTVLDVANVIWCTGFRQDFSWLDLPVVREDGWPDELRGVVPTAPGLYFCGLAFQYAFSSMVLVGVGRDAEHVARQVDARMGATDARVPV
jgi:putative flavoprotein involved in K+ transport